jgi:hypothetical protein
MNVEQIERFSGKLMRLPREMAKSLTNFVVE